MSPLSRTKAFTRDPGERLAGEPHHRESSRLTQAVDLPIFPLAEHDLEPRLVPFVTQHPHLRGPRRAAVHFDALLPFENVTGAHLSRYLGNVDVR